MIHVIKPGMLSMVQDLGRFGYAHLGLSTAGAADSLSFRMANLLVGNREDAPAIEMTLLGPTLEIHSAATLAICGARTSASVPRNAPFAVAAGSRIAFGPLAEGARAYLAVRGGLVVPAVMNSCSTFLAANIGGFEGRAFKAGDQIPIGNETVGATRKLRADFVASLTPRDGPIRVTSAPQSDWFDQETRQRFTQQTFIVKDSNRSGLRLQGEPLLPATRRELLTEGIALGAVQVPADGQPIILFLDQQTTGGYPKIANVITADLPRIAQLRPREPARFRFVTISEALDSLRDRQRKFHAAFA